MPVILDTQEAEIRRIVVQRQPRKIVLKTLSWKYPSQNKTKQNKKKKRAGRVVQGMGPEFKPQYHKKKNSTKRLENKYEELPESRKKREKKKKNQ
jgi:hypothetical protein